MLIEYLIDGGTVYVPVDNMIFTPDDGSLMWTIPNTPSANCLVRISDYPDGDPSDVSDTFFTISTSVTESITIVAPNGGENWQVGTQQEIIWTSSNFDGQVHIEYSTDAGISYSDILPKSPRVPGLTPSIHSRIV